MVAGHRLGCSCGDRFRPVRTGPESCPHSQYRESDCWYFRLARPDRMPSGMPSEHQPGDDQGLGRLLLRVAYAADLYSMNAHESNEDGRQHRVERHAERPFEVRFLPPQDEQRTAGQQEEQPEHRGRAGDQLVDVAVRVERRVEVRSRSSRHASPRTCRQWYASSTTAMSRMLNAAWANKAPSDVRPVLLAGQPREQLVVAAERPVEPHPGEQEPVDRAKRGDHDQGADRPFARSRRTAGRTCRPRSLSDSADAPVAKRAEVREVDRHVDAPSPAACR